MKNLKTSILLIIATITFSCSKNDPPTSKVIVVVTETPTEITATQAKLGGNVVSDGGSPVTKRGVCVALTPNPTIDVPENVLEIGAGIGAFSETLIELPSNTTGHVRAFATNANGTVYGEDKQFATLSE